MDVFTTVVQTCKKLIYSAYEYFRKHPRHKRIPVCLAACHISYGSIRMEPVFMFMGQRTATVAVHAIYEQTAVQGIESEKLKIQLKKDGQVLDFE